MLSLDNSLSSLRTVGTKSDEILVSLRVQWWVLLLADGVGVWDPWSSDMPWKELLFVDKAQLVGYLQGLANSSVGVRRRLPATMTMHMALLRTLLMRRVWVLQHWTGAQYCDTALVHSTQMWSIPGRAAIGSAFASAPHPEPASRFSSATRDFSFLRKASIWRRNVGDLSCFTPRLVGTGQDGSKLLFV